MKLSSSTVLLIAIVPLLLVAGVLPTASHPLYLLRVSTEGAVEERYWVVDTNGGSLKDGDEVEAYFYNEAIALGASPHFTASWNPQQLPSFALSRLESDNAVFDGSLLNIGADGAYALKPVSSKNLAASSAALCSLPAVNLR